MREIASMPRPSLAQSLLATTPLDPSMLGNPDIAHLVVHENEVLSSHLVPGLEVEVQKLEEGVGADIRVTDNVVIAEPVHLCFGVLPEEGLQRIVMRMHICKGARAAFLAHCTFPNALDVRHLMEADIQVDESAKVSYFERHIHGDRGGVKVYPTARVGIGKGATYESEFELLHGRVGLIDINYEATCESRGTMAMIARISGKGTDEIIIREAGHLVGEEAVGVLTSRVALSGSARAEVYNTITASSPYARGHVDCKEIVRDNAFAKAIPIVEVEHPKARVTHEAAIGGVDMKQLETLMSRGLTEDEASDLIVKGLLS